MTRLIDRGAITAGWVGMGVAVTLALSFLLIIPIEPIYWVLSLPAGLLIGYYANSKADRRSGPWFRILVNGVFAGLVTGLSMAVLLLAIKAIFFYADNGYPDFNRVDQAGQPIPPFCETGRGCVYARYEADRGAELRAAGITDAASFEGDYWNQQAAASGAVALLTVLGGAGGAILYGVARPKPDAEAESATV